MLADDSALNFVPWMNVTDKIICPILDLDYTDQQSWFPKIVQSMTLRLLPDANTDLLNSYEFWQSDDVSGVQNDIYKNHLNSKQ